MNVAAVCAFAAAAVAAITVLRRVDPGHASLAAAAAGAAMLVYIADSLLPLISDVRSIAETAGAGEYFAVMFKALAISLTCRMSCDVCSDCGESGLASKIELAGKTAMVAVSLPIVKQLIEQVRELI